MQANRLLSSFFNLASCFACGTWILCVTRSILTRITAPFSKVSISALLLREKAPNIVSYCFDLYPIMVPLAVFFQYHYVGS